MNSAVIVDVVRTASGRGKPGGALSGVHRRPCSPRRCPHWCGANDLDPALIDDVIGGCVCRKRESRR